VLRSVVVTYYTVNIYDIFIVQNSNGDLLSIKIEEYEPESTKTTKYFQNDEDIH
jgi:hypothetical protein